ncbi:two-component sensor histidine kinase [Pleurocapsa sp. CCALA 161]|uniref:two-component system sensor histidine kinase RppB n=1 Tax=Pleurocapsa sp. CCALA 161 TaxID=2107688 RepID=UPI000D064215|nr:two-component sensor histidine kinase [Pleurocapsa sp. CCALA 161]
MRQNKLFNKTRVSLSLWYAGVMGLILSLLGMGVYKAISHAHWVALDNELESVAGTLHDSLELKLKQPGQIEPIIKKLLPNLCLVETSCISERFNSQRHILSAIDRGNYYARLYDMSGRLIAIAGDYPEGLPQALNKKPWQTFKDGTGNIYHQISLSLHTQTREDWGYFQVGRSLADFEDYLGRVKLVLLLGLPISLILVAVASWWLAGLAMQPIYRSYQQIEQFTADAAHELRTPLAATQATVESSLLVDLDKQETKDILTTIKQENKRLIQLVADLLWLARMDRKAIPLRQQLCCLNDLVDDLVEELEPLAIANQITLTSEFRVKKSINVSGDCDQLYRLVYNLIVNAIQYTPSEGRVTVILERDASHALIQVKDTGIGIAPEHQKKIFDRFYRIQDDRSRSTGGSGLGLAIAQSIARSHSCKLSVRSELGQGSTFIFQLPLASNLRDTKSLIP